ncbi:MAG: SAVED domain-containing protein [Phormidesmis sp. RL_2_1]|nr:SAVED domain-containing protein [Phormidesmis sp. RL_2_1]
METTLSRRRPSSIPAESIWKDKLFPDLAQAKQFFTKVHSGECIDLRAKLPLPAMLAIGAAFPELAYRFQYEQNTRGQTSLWQSNISPSMLKFRVVEERAAFGKQLLIAFGITATAQKDTENLFQKSPELFSALVYAEPEAGVGDAVISNADAIALAIHAKELIRAYRQKYDAELIHLIMLAPAGFALFLGQKLNALGEVVSYEWMREEGCYQPAVRLQV